MANQEKSPSEKEKKKRKLFSRKKEATESEKLQERREEVLSKGRKFKYPLQYSKHRMVIITIILAIAAVIATGVMGYLSLYKFQSTSELLYRVTRVLPLSVAKIDGERVPFSDYLMIYRSSIRPVEQQSGSLDGEDAEERRTYFKRMALTEAENYTYAEKLARDLGITVPDEEVDQAFDAHRKVGDTELTRESFLRILKDNFEMSESEYRRMLWLSLLKMKVSEKIDTEAKKLAEEVLLAVTEGVLPEGETEGALKKLSFKEAGERYSAWSVQYEDTGGLTSIQNVDGGRANQALNLEKGGISEVFLSSNGDGYYIVKLVEKQDGEVNYESLFIPFTEFSDRLQQIRDDGKVEEYITLDQMSSAPAEEIVEQ